MPKLGWFDQVSLRARALVIAAAMFVLSFTCLAYSAISFISNVSLAGTFGAAPWSPISAYVGSIGVTHPASFWQRFLIIEGVEYVSDYYRGTEAWVVDDYSHIGVIEASRMPEFAADVHFVEAVGHRLVMPEIIIRIDRYRTYEGPMPSDERDRARITVCFRLLWLHFTVKAGD